MSFFSQEIPTIWSRLWIAMWVACIATLFVLVPFVTPTWWMFAATFLFGLPEAIGLVAHRDPYPPLTYVIRHYFPRWVTHTVIFAAWGGIAAFWLGFPHPLRMAALFGLLGWLQDHFDVTYDDGDDQDDVPGRR